MIGFIGSFYAYEPFRRLGLDDANRFAWVMGPSGPPPRKLVGTPAELDRQAAKAGAARWRPSLWDPS